MRGRCAVLFLARLAEPLFGLRHIFLANIIPAEQQRVACELFRFGKPFKPHQIGRRDGDPLFLSCLRHELAREIVLDRLEFQLSIGAGLFLGQKLTHHFRRQQRGCLLHGGEPVTCDSAIVENVEIGVARPCHPVRIGKGIGNPPQNVYLAAGQQTGIIGGRIHHRRILLEVRRVDEALTRLGQRQHAGQVVRRLPARLCLLAVGNRFPDLGITAVGIKLPHGIELRIAIFRDSKRISRWRPVRIKRAKSRDFGLKALRIASRGEIAQCAEIDFRHITRRRLRHARGRRLRRLCLHCLGAGLWQRSRLGCRHRYRRGRGLR